MAGDAEIRKALEAVVGRELPAGIGDDVVVVREYIAVWTSEESQVTSREIGTTGDSTKRCRREGALDVGGTSRTDANGTVEIRLTDYICQPPTPYEFFRPINFVATPQSRAPVFLTSVQTPTGGDVAIMVFSWDANGSPLRNVSFDWRCFVPAEVQFA